MSEKIDRYFVKNSFGAVVYRCASGHLSEIHIITEIKKRYESDGKLYRIYKNGELLTKINTIKQRTGKRIKDISSGQIFDNIDHLADYYGISKIEARKWIKERLKFKIL